MDQTQRDERVQCLVGSIASLYSYLEDLDTNRINAFEATIKRLLKVTTACAYFIVEYCRIVSFSEFSALFFDQWKDSRGLPCSWALISVAFVGLGKRNIGLREPYQFVRN